MSFATKLTTILWLALCLTLTACGGGGGGGDSSGGGDNVGTDDPGDGGDGGGGSGDGDGDGNGGGNGHGDNGPPPREEAPVLEVTSGIKQLNLTWDTHENDDHYHLWEHRDGGDVENTRDFEAGTGSFTQEVAVHRYNWAELSYEIEACGHHTEGDFPGCINSAPVDVEDTMLGAIGYFKAANAEAAELGRSLSVSSDGRVVAVGSAGNGGAGGVYVYSHTDDGWQTPVQLTLPDTAGGTAFGASVAVSDDGQHVAVGAPSTESGDGYIYVFTSSEGTWNQSGVVSSGSDGFARSLALDSDGNMLVVGSPSETQPSQVQLFRLADGVWAEVTSWTSTDAAGDAGFGHSVAISNNGSTVAVGSPDENGGSGAAHVYTGDAGWALVTSLNAEATGFGHRVALSADGSTLAASSRGADDSGTVYVFTEGETWEQSASLRATNAVAGDQFGESLAISGDGALIAVGVPNDDSDGTGVNSGVDGGAAGAGAVYTFELTDGAWTETAYVKAPNTDTADQFGSSVALNDDGNTLAVGAPGEDSAAMGIGGDQQDNAAENSGAVYLY